MSRITKTDTNGSQNSGDSQFSASGSSMLEFVRQLNGQSEDKATVAASAFDEISVNLEIRQRAVPLSSPPLSYFGSPSEFMDEDQQQPRLEQNPAPNIMKRFTNSFPQSLKRRSTFSDSSKSDKPLLELSKRKLEGMEDAILESLRKAFTLRFKPKDSSVSPVEKGPNPPEYSSPTIPVPINTGQGLSTSAAPIDGKLARISEEVPVGETKRDRVPSQEVKLAKESIEEGSSKVSEATPDTLIPKESDNGKLNPVISEPQSQEIIQKLGKVLKRKRAEQARKAKRLEREELAKRLLEQKAIAEIDGRKAVENPMKPTDLADNIEPLALRDSSQSVQAMPMKDISATGAAPYNALTGEVVPAKEPDTAIQSIPVANVSKELKISRKDVPPETKAIEAAINSTEKSVKTVALIDHHPPQAIEKAVSGDRSAEGTKTMLLDHHAALSKRPPPQTRSRGSGSYDCSSIQFSPFVVSKFPELALRPTTTTTKFKAKKQSSNRPTQETVTTSWFRKSSSSLFPLLARISKKLSSLNKFTTLFGSQLNIVTDDTVFLPMSHDAGINDLPSIEVVESHTIDKSGRGKLLPAEPKSKTSQWRARLRAALGSGEKSTREANGVKDAKRKEEQRRSEKKKKKGKKKRKPEQTTKAESVIPKPERPRRKSAERDADGFKQQGSTVTTFGTPKKGILTNK